MPWLLGALGVLAAFAIAWLSDILNAFQHFPGLPGRARALRFFAIGDVTWGVALLVAVVALTVGLRVVGGARPGVGSRVTRAYNGIAAAAGIVTLAALISAIVALTLAGQHATPSDQVAYAAIGLPAGLDQAVVAALSSLAAVPLAAAAGWWALHAAGPAGRPGPGPRAGRWDEEPPG